MFSILFIYFKQYWWNCKGWYDLEVLFWLRSYRQINDYCEVMWSIILQVSAPFWISRNRFFPLYVSCLYPKKTEIRHVCALHQFLLIFTKLDCNQTLLKCNPVLKSNIQSLELQTPVGLPHSTNSASLEERKRSCH